MRDVPGLSNVHQRTPRPGAELVITPKPDEAARLGVSAETLGGIARVATLGDVDSNTAKFNTGEQRVSIRVRLPDEARADLSTLRNLRVPTASGKLVPLSAVATLSFQAGVARIDRYDRQRRAIVEAQFNGISLGDANKAVDALPIMQALPEGITQPLYGDSERMADLFAGFSGAMLAGVGLIFAVMVLLFHSFFKPITILTALPLSLAGAFAGLLIAQIRTGAVSADRLADADGPGGQELDPAGGVRHRGRARGRFPARGDTARLPRARPAHRHDHGGDGGRHAAHRARHWRGRRSFARRWPSP